MAELNTKNIETLKSTPTLFKDIEDGNIFGFRGSSYLFMKTYRLYGSKGYSTCNAIDLLSGDLLLVDEDDEITRYEVGLILNGNLIGK